MRTGGESKLSDDPIDIDAKVVDARRRHDYSDAIIGAGLLLLAGGAGLFHIGAGLIVAGLALLLIGTRGSAQGG